MDKPSTLQNAKGPSRQKIISAVLKETGNPLTVDELVTKTSLNKEQIRNVVSSKFDTPIVYVGKKGYGLAKNVFENFIFRYTLSPNEILHKTLRFDDDLERFLGWFNVWQPIKLVSDKNKIYKISRVRPTKTIPYFHFRGLTKIFTAYKLKPRDNLLFTPVDFNERAFKIEYLPKEKRHEEKIKTSNRIYADILYDLLNRSFRKQDWLIFLAPKSLPLLASANLKEPADDIVHAIENDTRFILAKDIADETTLALRKYSVFYHKNKNHPSTVVIEKDQFGSYGFCEDCGIPLQWLPVSGWIHPDADPLDYKIYRDEVELEKSFFKQK